MKQKNNKTKKINKIKYTTISTRKNRYYRKHRGSDLPNIHQKESYDFSKIHPASIFI